MKGVVYVSFGKTLKRVLDERGLRAIDLADESLSAQYLSKLITGRTKSPTWEKALIIVDKLGMTPTEFRQIELEVESQQDKRKAH